ncbi:OLC1v1033586C1 [Oldenlandia corymbosa var. corymbosa]|uniref:OLC1v1033586C1 n=1 Tax=Oldenlandia corymbosa var. corymbosa TaxID=529605 RepID=A0AAV1CRH9_OLDCO|nr:OLC1v1033586C1 [Oldenlandia corymbosa var. corymbosa]
MEPTSALAGAGGKPSFLRNILVRLFLFCVFILGVRFAYVVTLRGESCDLGDFCFFSLPDNLDGIVSRPGQFLTGGAGASASAVIAVGEGGKSAPAKPQKLPDLWATKGFQKAARFYSSVFTDLLSEGFLAPNSKALCLDTPTGADVFALKEIGVSDSIGIHKKASKPLVISGQAVKHPFGDAKFDFIFSGDGMIEKSAKPADIAAEVCRTLKPQGFFVAHTGSKDPYSHHSFLELFNCCKLVQFRDIDGFNSSLPLIREIIMQKVADIGDNLGNDYKKCSVPGYKQELLRKAEPLIIEEPKKPWITLKRNIQNVKYLSSMADINFKRRYVYVDVGSRSYGSSIVSWFKKQYPKQDKNFDIYAIEADKHFHDDYKNKKGVQLLPYAAWVKNESLFFEINQDHLEEENVVKGRGMGRIKPVQNVNGNGHHHVDEIQGFDFAEWLKSTVTERDFVVMKMDVEGTEFDLIPRLIETGAICLVDEVFLECHYNRWQKCCPGERSPKYEKTYDQCLELFTSLRQRGVLVHQWW